MRRFANVSTSTCSTPSSLTALLIDPIAMSLDGENGTPRNTLPSSSRDTKPNVIWQTELGTSKCHSTDTPMHFGKTAQTHGPSVENPSNLHVSEIDQKTTE